MRNLTARAALRALRVFCRDADPEMAAAAADLSAIVEQWSRNPTAPTVARAERRGKESSHV